MTEQPERQRLRPTLQGRARLLAAIQATGPLHDLDTGTLGEYAELVVVRGHAEAAGAFPEVAAHLAGGCPSCAEDFRELIALAAEPDGDLMPGDAPFTPEKSPTPPPGAGKGAQASVSVTPAHRERGPGGEGRLGDDSGIFAADLPNPRAHEAAEAARLQRLRRIRDRLLVAAAAAILLIGLSLVGLAYVASQSQGARVELVPVPPPASSPGSVTGRASPTGMSCPVGFPIKGNRASMIYHQPGAEFYDQTRPEDCFAGPGDAEAAGYRRSQR